MNKTSVESFNVSCRCEFHQEMLFQRPKIQNVFYRGHFPPRAPEVTSLTHFCFMVLRSAHACVRPPLRLGLQVMWGEICCFCNCWTISIFLSIERRMFNSLKSIPAVLDFFSEEFGITMTKDYVLRDKWILLSKFVVFLARNILFFKGTILIVALKCSPWIK